MIATSKKRLAANLYSSMTKAGRLRKDVITQMIEVVGLTPSGASTYYQNFKSGVWSADSSSNTINRCTGTSTSLQKEFPIAQDRLDLMSNYDLLVLHNKHALISLVNFISREHLMAEVRKFVHVY